ncbi:DUF3152 domain-containing protein [Streptomyces sp. TRM 70361]|uniref:DUF3152 domain-containing protein n=1 Tax=Streptomyces sp. TRM 70361 TaxID=3116553 RepID=UPI002E7BE4C0|nr:DUF3152 domain-containing protein [Streptomyces sp. TRM 70361]MEE1939177.1 DUF3152 domain-containing protein [Streptomyces sp. TRM 70361]
MGRHSRRGGPAAGKPTTTGTGRYLGAREEAPRPHPAPPPPYARRDRAPRPGPPEPEYASAGDRAVPAQGAAGVRGGHPEHREPGGAWGLPGPRAAAVAGRPGGAPPPGVVHGTGRTPRQEYLDAFDAPGASNTPGAPGDGAPAAPARPAPAGGSDGPAGTGGHRERGERGGRGRAFTGVAAAAVTTVLAVVVAGQVTDLGTGAGDTTGAAGGSERAHARDTSRSDPRSDARPTPARTPPAAPAAPSGSPAATTDSYDRLMARLYELAPDAKGSGRLVPVAGRNKAPDRGEIVRYRVDVEDGLPLDGELFARAVHRTLNDERSWSHGDVRTFERVSGDAGDEPDFVITLASPATTGVWCAKSGLDTTVDNVSCDSAATERIMINAYRWARGAETFGPERIREYREMLINHEVGHRLGKGHVNCPRDGARAPVMMQQTKTLKTGGATCRPNAWPFP